jgi:hypothetical protein
MFEGNRFEETGVIEGRDTTPVDSVLEARTMFSKGLDPGFTAAKQRRDSLIQQAFILLTGTDGVTEVVIKGAFGEIIADISREADGRSEVQVTAHAPLTDEPPAS